MHSWAAHSHPSWLVVWVGGVTYLEHLGVVGAAVIGPVGLKVHALLLDPLHPSPGAAVVVAVGLCRVADW